MVTTDAKLYLHEEILLLVLRDVEGTENWCATYHHAMGGAIIAELLMSERIEISDDRKKHVLLKDASPLGDSVIDDALKMIIAARRKASLQTWMTRIACMKNLRHRVAEGLCKRGILRAEEDRVLLVFRRRIYPQRDPKPERQIIDRLRRAIFTDTAMVDPRTVVLIALANSAEVLKVPFDRRKLKERKQRIEKIINGNLIGKAAEGAIRAAQTAAVMAAIMPAVVVTNVASN